MKFTSFFSIIICIHTCFSIQAVPLNNPEDIITAVIEDSQRKSSVSNYKRSSNANIYQPLQSQEIATGKDILQDNCKSKKNESRIINCNPFNDKNMLALQLKSYDDNITLLINLSLVLWNDIQLPVLKTTIQIPKTAATKSMELSIKNVINIAKAVYQESNKKKSLKVIQSLETVFILPPGFLESFLSANKDFEIERSNKEFAKDLYKALYPFLSKFYFNIPFDVRRYNLCLLLFLAILAFFIVFVSLTAVSVHAVVNLLISMLYEYYKHGHDDSILSLIEMG